MTVNNEMLQLKTVFLPAYIDLTKQSSDKANQSVTPDAYCLAGTVTVLAVQTNIF